MVIDDGCSFIAHLPCVTELLEQVPLLMTHSHPTPMPKPLIERLTKRVERRASEAKICPKRQAAWTTRKTHTAVVLKCGIGLLRTIN